MVTASSTALPRQTGRLPDKVLAETEQRFFKKEPMDAQGHSDLAAKRRELVFFKGLEARKSFGVDRLRGQDGLRTAEEQLASTSAFLKALRVRIQRRRQGFHEEVLRVAWKRRDLAGYLSLEPASGRSTLGCREEGLQGNDCSVAFHDGLAG